MFVQRISKAVCSFSPSQIYLQLHSNGILPQKSQLRSWASGISCKEEILTFYHSAVGGVSHGLFLTLFHPHVAQECILEVQ